MLETIKATTAVDELKARIAANLIALQGTGARGHPWRVFTGDIGNRTQKAAEMKNARQFEANRDRRDTIPDPRRCEWIWCEAVIELFAKGNAICQHGCVRRTLLPSNDKWAFAHCSPYAERDRVHI